MPSEPEQETRVYNDGHWELWSLSGKRQSMAGSILREAAELVDGERHEAYGNSHANMAHTAAVWSAYLGVTVTPEDVAWMLGMAKACRAKKGAYHPDNYRDAAGYAAIAGDMAGDKR